MSRIDKQISLSRPVLISVLQGPPEIIELILKFAQWLYEGEYYTRDDLANLPLNVSRIFMLKLKVNFRGSDHANFIGAGKVKVTRVQAHINCNHFIFRFIIKNRKPYVFIRGRICKCSDNYPMVMVFHMKCHQDFLTVFLLPYKLEFKN